MPTVEVLDPASVAYGDALAVAELNLLIWPQDAATPEHYARNIIDRQGRGDFAPGSDQWYVIRGAEGRLVAKAETFVREVGTAAGPLKVLALAGVCTRPEARKQGLGSAVVAAAFARADRGPVRWCYYQTSHRNRPFYEKLGAVLATNRVVNSLGKDPQANPFWDEITMRYPGGAGWPEGTIDLRGPGY